jgi:hypothetical protein
MRILSLIVIMLGVAVILSCSSGSSTGPDEARLQVYLQDTPILFDSVFVNIKQIAIRSTMEYQDSTSGWRILFDVPTSYDLIKLRNGNRQLMFNRNIPVGTYRPLRIILGVCLAMRNDTVYSLEFPQPTDSLVYGSGYIEVAKNKTARTLIDFDLFSSVSYNADSSRYYFDPQFTFIDIDSTGDMHGKVTPAANVYLIRDSDTLTFTSTEAITNDFGFYGLREGLYNLAIVSQDTIHADLIEENIPIVRGTDYNLGTIDLPHH